MISSSINKNPSIKSDYLSKWLFNIALKNYSNILHLFDICSGVNFLNNVFAGNGGIKLSGYYYYNDSYNQKKCSTLLHTEIPNYPTTTL